MLSYLVNCVLPLLVDRPIFREIQWIDDQDRQLLLFPFADTELSKRFHVLKIDLAWRHD